MASKEQLQKSRTGTIINYISDKREGRVNAAIIETLSYLNELNFGVTIKHTKEWKLSEIVHELLTQIPGSNFYNHFERSTMRPDGGILYLTNYTGKKFPILITELKNQGTNDQRQKEGKSKQAKGNAIERLGKNVIGFRTAMIFESIFPFVCFGDGCDFAPDSSILDRVSTIAMFSKLNEIHVHNFGPFNMINPGSFFFREKLWTSKEMSKIMKEIAEESVKYYVNKYGKEFI